ncbi:hypothetical protein QAD02_024404 [Eretmocerus hayati]|uniref:Uncharacterized protein n=1 Tax=Eretmocerus hayati TaxID=131215 RepID=A0ACC2Q171_9HYME|nr:hypothetical protein QAD02_024404 [Eretmocerus hayati]
MEKKRTARRNDIVRVAGEGQLEESRLQECDAASRIAARMSDLEEIEVAQLRALLGLCAVERASSSLAMRRRMDELTRKLRSCSKQLHRYRSIERSDAAIDAIQDELEPVSTSEKEIIVQPETADCGAQNDETADIEKHLCDAETGRDDDVAAVRQQATQQTIPAEDKESWAAVETVSRGDSAKAAHRSSSVCCGNYRSEASKAVQSSLAEPHLGPEHPKRSESHAQTDMLSFGGDGSWYDGFFSPCPGDLRRRPQSSDASKKQETTAGANASKKSSKIDLEENKGKASIPAKADCETKNPIRKSSKTECGSKTPNPINCSTGKQEKTQCLSEVANTTNCQVKFQNPTRCEIRTPTSSCEDIFKKVSKIKSDVIKKVDPSENCSGAHRREPSSRALPASMNQVIVGHASLQELPKNRDVFQKNKCVSVTSKATLPAQEVENVNPLRSARSGSTVGRSRKCNRIFKFDCNPSPLVKEDLQKICHPGAKKRICGDSRNESRERDPDDEQKPCTPKGMNERPVAVLQSSTATTVPQTKGIPRAMNQTATNAKSPIPKKGDKECTISKQPSTGVSSPRAAANPCNSGKTSTVVKCQSSTPRQPDPKCDTTAKRPITDVKASPAADIPCATSKAQQSVKPHSTERANKNCDSPKRGMDVNRSHDKTGPCTASADPATTKPRTPRKTDDKSDPARKASTNIATSRPRDGPCCLNKSPPTHRPPTPKSPEKKNPQCKKSATRVCTPPASRERPCSPRSSPKQSKGSAKQQKVKRCLSAREVLIGIDQNKFIEKPCNKKSSGHVSDKKEARQCRQATTPSKPDGSELRGKKSLNQVSPRNDEKVSDCGKPCTPERRPECDQRSKLPDPEAQKMKLGKFTVELPDCGNPCGSPLEPRITPSQLATIIEPADSRPRHQAPTRVASSSGGSSGGYFECSSADAQTRACATVTTTCPQSAERQRDCGDAPLARIMAYWDRLARGLPHMGASMLERLPCTFDDLLSHLPSLPAHSSTTGGAQQGTRGLICGSDWPLSVAQCDRRRRKRRPRRAPTNTRPLAKVLLRGSCASPVGSNCSRPSRSRNTTATPACVESCRKIECRENCDRDALGVSGGMNATPAMTPGVADAVAGAYALRNDCARKDQAILTKLPRPREVENRPRWRRNNASELVGLGRRGSGRIPRNNARRPKPGPSCSCIKNHCVCDI